MSIRKDFALVYLLELKKKSYLTHLPNPLSARPPVHSVLIWDPDSYSRHGESMFNTKGLIGGNPELSPLGKRYAEVLEDFVEQSDELSTDEVNTCTEDVAIFNVILT